MNLLLVEDDPMIGKSLSRALTDGGMQVRWVTDGLAAEALLQANRFALVLLDLGLPGKSGFDVLRRMRQDGDTTPLIIVTARDAVDDRVTGLNLGADDYVIKPFGIHELMARVQATLRRCDSEPSNVIGNGELTLDLATRLVSYRGKTLSLPAREFALLTALIDRAGSVLSRAQLEQLVYASESDIESNAIDVLIHYLRKRFDKEIIRNVRGVGWMVMKHPA